MAVGGIQARKDALLASGRVGRLRFVTFSGMELDGAALVGCYG